MIQAHGTSKSLTVRVIWLRKTSRAIASKRSRQRADKTSSPQFREFTSPQAHFADGTHSTVKVCGFSPNSPGARGQHVEACPTSCSSPAFQCYTIECLTTTACVCVYFTAYHQNWQQSWSIVQHFVTLSVSSSSICIPSWLIFYVVVQTALFRHAPMGSLVQWSIESSTPHLCSSIL